jgi:hypothetical protein
MQPIVTKPTVNFLSKYISELFPIQEVPSDILSFTLILIYNMSLGMLKLFRTNCKILDRDTSSVKIQRRGNRHLQILPFTRPQL